MMVTEIVDVSGTFTLAEAFNAAYLVADSTEYLALFNAIRDAVSDVFTCFYAFMCD